jgi:Carboxypeptidase regulatory-like domain
MMDALSAIGSATGLRRAIQTGPGALTGRVCDRDNITSSGAATAKAIQTSAICPHRCMNVIHNGVPILLNQTKTRMRGRGRRDWPSFERSSRKDGWSVSSAIGTCTDRNEFAGNLKFKLTHYRLPSRMNRPRKLVVSILVTVGIVLTGCSNSSRLPTYPVTGTVTSQGKPVAGAVITFVPTGNEGEAASAITDSNGKYALTTWQAGDGARPGEYRVKVSKQEQATVDPAKLVQNLSIEEEQKIYVESKKAPPPAKRLIPSKFENEQTSGLIHKVEDKPTTFDIKIE